MRAGCRHSPCHAEARAQLSVRDPETPPRYPPAAAYTSILYICLLAVSARPFSPFLPGRRVHRVLYWAGGVVRRRRRRRAHWLSAVELARAHTRKTPAHGPKLPLSPPTRPADQAGTLAPLVADSGRRRRRCMRQKSSGQSPLRV